jgi:hypothetical protein
MKNKYFWKHYFECAFHVRLIPDFKLRVDNLISGREMSRDEAINLIAKYDKSQKAFFRYALSSVNQFSCSGRLSGRLDAW